MADKERHGALCVSGYGYGLRWGSVWGWRIEALRVGVDEWGSVYNGVMGLEGVDGSLCV